MSRDTALETARERKAREQLAPAPPTEIFDTRRVVQTLEGLMTKVTDNDVNPNTVNAACNCADKIVDILRLHLDVERLRRKPAGGVRAD